MESSEAFIWERQGAAEEVLLSCLSALQSKSGFIDQLSKDMELLTSTRLLDWVDHFMLPASADMGAFVEAGFVKTGEQDDTVTYMHPGAQLPRLVVYKNTANSGIAVKAEHIASFLNVRGMAADIEGSPYSSFRRALVHEEDGVQCWAVERRGAVEHQPVTTGAEGTETYLKLKERWATRPRQLVSLPEQDKQMDRALELADELVTEVGKDLAAWIVCEVEREFWQAKNRAGQTQKNRQDRLGLGWANHDHHTFRSSRHLFPKLIQLFIKLGFHCREKFYAGEEAGWGAQVMEQSNCGLVLFLDVDLQPNEVSLDFLNIELPELESPGTVGMWCLLHGDSITSAGMHHLEAQFNFEDLRDDLKERGIGMMQPFSNFDYLKQAFTEGETWHVPEAKLQELLDGGYIDEVQAQRFREKGAVGSHLENLERRDGFKGFNQQNVSWIIKKTDPRTLERSSS